MTISEGFRDELANPSFNLFHFIYVKCITWVTDLYSVDLFVVLRLVKDMFRIISVKFGPPRNINCI